MGPDMPEVPSAGVLNAFARRCVSVVRRAAIDVAAGVLFEVLESSSQLREALVQKNFQRALARFQPGDRGIDTVQLISAPAVNGCSDPGCHVCRPRDTRARGIC